MGWRCGWRCCTCWEGRTEKHDLPSNLAFVMKRLITSGRVRDPSQDLDGKLDVLIEDGLIARVDKRIKGDVETIDAKGLVVVPGFIDLHTHLREPGQEHKETIATGTRAAVAGG